jgi:TFIIH basal transcription factor complex TTD-A subunit
MPATLTRSPHSTPDLLFAFSCFSDIPLTQFIISLDEQAPASEKFINHILDDTHLLVQPHKVEEIQQQVRSFQEANTYTAPSVTDK